MKKRHILVLAGCLLFGGVGMAHAGTTYFDVTDVPGRWFDTGADIAGTRSLAIVAPGEIITFLQETSKYGPSGNPGPSRVESRHTVTSLIWPSTAPSTEQIDQTTANKTNQTVTLSTPGLHVFVCKVHPYMLGAVIVKGPSTDTDGVLDIGPKIHLLATGEFTSNSNLALRLLRAFFVITNPANWQDYSKVGRTYLPDYPSVDIRVGGPLNNPPDVGVVNLKTTLQTVFPGVKIRPAQKPAIPGVGEVWVDTQYELSKLKGEAYPGTITVVDVGHTAPGQNWRVKQKIALPAQKMNNGHNMWASHDQKQIYQTEWHGKSLFVIDRVHGQFLNEIEVGHDPAHVMSRVDTEQVHVTLNGEDAVVELNHQYVSPYLQINPLLPGGQGRIPMQLFGEDQAQPHAHWMGFDGHTMATPNSNTADSTLYSFLTDTIVGKVNTGALPIAAAMNPNSTKYYVSNYLSNTTSVINMTTTPPTWLYDINLLANYNAISGPTGGPVGALPIQTPVSPDGKFVVTANTLTGTITIINTFDDTLVGMVPCDPGCHGVNFGAKKGGGYYAYVTSKFSNRLIVLDYDPNNDGNVDDATIAGWVVLADNNAPSDDSITGNKGMGGQGVLPIPLVYNGWVQKLPPDWCAKLSVSQRSPFPGTVIPACTP